MAAPDAQAAEAAALVSEGGDGAGGSRAGAAQVSGGGGAGAAQVSAGGSRAGVAQVSGSRAGATLVSGSRAGAAQVSGNRAGAAQVSGEGAGDAADAGDPGERAAPGRSDQHTIALYVNDRPGVLVRVALVFARRGFNIESLVVSPSALGGFSRMTITCSGAPEVLEQIIKALNRLVDVVHATDHTDDASYETEIALVKIAGKVNQRTEILQIAEHYEAKVVDYGSESLILRVAGGSDKIDAFIELLRPFGIVELVRSGKLLMARGLMET